MPETTIGPQDQSENIQSGTEIVADFVRQIAANQKLDKDTGDAVVGLHHRAGKLTATNLLNSLESARGRPRHGSPTKA